MRTVELPSVQGQPIDSFGSLGFAALVYMGKSRVTVCRLEPGGRIGRHKAPVDQLFVVVSGFGKISDGSVELQVGTGQAVQFDAGDEHETTSSEGLYAVILESPELAGQV